MRKGRTQATGFVDTPSSDLQAAPPRTQVLVEDAAICLICGEGRRRAEKGGPTRAGAGEGGGEMIHPGSLVRDADGYYALVLRCYQNGALDLQLSNGLRVLASAGTVTVLGLREGDEPNPPALFHEILVIPPWI
jgi:hypothetical protein